MSNLKWHEKAHLFCGGGFEFLPPEKERTCLLQFLYESEGTLVFEYYARGTYEESFEAKDCTLIVRSIDDMTDEEWGKMPMFYGSGLSIRNKELKLKAEITNLSVPDFLYLLSIGVFPEGIFSTEGVEFV